MKSLVLSFLVASTVVASSTLALAGDGFDGRYYIGEPPLDVSTLSREGPVTVAGVVATGGDGVLVLDDGTGQVRLDLEDLAALPLAAGEEVTVLGTFDDGRVEARRLIRQDGTVQSDDD